MRTKYSAVNAVVSIIAQIITIVITFISRKIFLMTLGETVLGINSLFSQIISMMSLVELGIGSAIIYSLYKPLADENKPQIAAIMRLYRKIYTIIGILVFVIGVCITPFITWFITGDISAVDHLYIIFLLFVINAALSYFNSYKQNLIVADQKKYITIINHYGLFVILNIFQIIILIRIGNFIFYLILQILVTILENVILSYKTKKMYPYLSEYKSEQMEKETINHMKKNVKALICHRVGGIFVSSTDTLIISKFVGIVVVGKYTNYNYITNAFNTLTSNLFSSFTSSVGNYNVKATNDDNYKLFKKLFLLNFMVFGFISICCYCLMNDFIRIFFGEKMLLENVVVILMVLKFYFNGMRSALLTYKDALGIYHEDRYRPIVEGMMNLVLSLFFVKYMGLVGVILATIMSNLIVNLSIEPSVVFKLKFEKSVYEYLIKYMTYFVMMIMVGWGMRVFSSMVVVNTFLGLVIKAFVIAGATLFLICVISLIISKEEFKFYFKLIKNVLMKIKIVNLIKRKKK